MTDNELLSCYCDGTKVKLLGSDYTFDGTVQAIFSKRSGKLRCVVENKDGILHIFSSKNLELK